MTTDGDRRRHATAPLFACVCGGGAARALARAHAHVGLTSFEERREKQRDAERLYTAIVPFVPPGPLPPHTLLLSPLFVQPFQRTAAAQCSWDCALCAAYAPLCQCTPLSSQHFKSSGFISPPPPAARTSIATRALCPRARACAYPRCWRRDDSKRATLSPANPNEPTTFLLDLYARCWQHPDVRAAVTAAACLQRRPPPLPPPWPTRFVLVPSPFASGLFVLRPPSCGPTQKVIASF